MAENRFDDKNDEPSVFGAGAAMPDAEVQWLRAYGAAMISLGINPEDVALHMASMDRPDFTEDPEAAATGEVECWNNDGGDA